MGVIFLPGSISMPSYIWKRRKGKCGFASHVKKRREPHYHLVLSFHQSSSSPNLASLWAQCVDTLPCIANFLSLKFIFFLLIVSGSSHIQSVLIGIEYRNCCLTFVVYLLFALWMGPKYRKLILYNRGLNGDNSF